MARSGWRDRARFVINAPHSPRDKVVAAAAAARLRYVRASIPAARQKTRSRGEAIPAYSSIVNKPISSAWRDREEKGHFSACELTHDDDVNRENVPTRVCMYVYGTC